MSELENRIKEILHKRGLRSINFKNETRTFGEIIESLQVEAIMELIQQELEKQRIRVDEYYAYCRCGDSLERTGLYPKEATYYCSGCDVTYRLVEDKHE